MDNQAEVKLTYARYRLEKSKEDLEAAEIMYDSGHYRVANNRAYYSIFHAIRAVLAFEGFDSKSHGQIIGAFRKNYIKPGYLIKKCRISLVKHLKSGQPPIMTKCL